MHLLLLRPPRFVWPFNSETSAFWQPLGLACLAAAVRQSLSGLSVEILDCPASRIGWRTLAQRLAGRPIDVLGIGEETVSAHEGLRAAELVKRLHPACVVVAGGTYYAYALHATLGAGLVDVAVLGEGERTFVELLDHIRERSRWPAIRGIAFADGADIHVTPPRPLIENLDDLPMPAWDLLDMSVYGRGSRNHPALASIEHSRGCIDRCSFCILWRHMGETKDEGTTGTGCGDAATRRRGDAHVSASASTVTPRWRTKSPHRAFAEVRELYHRFGRRTFGWVDPTFNVSPQWSDEFADLLLGSELMGARGRARTLHTAWLRADGVVRDENAGVLAKLVRAGLRQVMIGVERDDEAGLAWLNKHSNGLETCREAIAILRRKYPEVYTIGTMIFGLPGDTPADIDRLIGRQYELGLDYCFLMPLTPNPGTDVASEAAAAGRIANAELASYNFHTPVLATERMNLGELERTYYRLMLRPHRRRFARLVRQMVLEPDGRKRRVHMALLRRGTGIAVRALVHRLFRPRDKQPVLYSRKPTWYDK